MKIIYNSQNEPNTFDLFYKIPADVDTSLLNDCLSLPILSYVTLNHILYPNNRYHTIPSCFFKRFFGREYAKALRAV